MSTSRNSWLRLLPAMLLALSTLFSTPALAEDEITDSWRYSATLAGKNYVDITVAAISFSGRDAYHRGSEIKYRVVGSNSWTTIFKIRTWTQDDDNSYANIALTSYTDYLYLTNPSNGANMLIADTETNCSVSKSTNDLNPVAKLRWQVPNELRGKSIEFYVKLIWDHTVQTTPDDKDIFISGQVDLPAAQEVQLPQLLEPMLSYDKASTGQVLIPWMIMAGDVKKYRVSYLDENNIRTYIEETNYTQSSGFISLYAGQEYHQLQIEVLYDHPDYGTTLGYLQSNTVNVKKLHTPDNFKAVEDDRGNVTLSWDVPDFASEDISDGDSWEIQRNSKGFFDLDESNWKTITNIDYSDYVSLENDIAHYEFLDETMLRNYDGPPLYRIRRMTTAHWNWEGNPASRWAQVKYLTRLSGLLYLSVQKSTKWDEGDHSVTLNWSQQDAYNPIPNTLPVMYGPSEVYQSYADAVAAGRTTLPTFVLSYFCGSWYMLQVDELLAVTKRSLNAPDRIETAMKSYGQSLSVSTTDYEILTESYNYNVLAEHGALSSMYHTIADITGKDITKKVIGGVERTALFNAGYNLAFKRIPDDPFAFSSTRDVRFSIDYSKYYVSARTLLMAKADLNEWLKNNLKYEDEQIYVFDPQAQLVLETFAINQQTRDTVEVIREILSEEEIAAKKLTRTLLRPCLDYEFRLTVNKGRSRLPLSETGMQKFATKLEGANAVYAFANTGSIPSLSTETNQDYVALAWEAKGDLADYYDVYRDGVLIASGLVQTYYSDKSALPKASHSYQVNGVSMCEGKTYFMHSPVMEGHIKPTGYVNGHVRMIDGTSMGGLSVSLNDGDRQVATTTTDAEGFYEFDEIEYEDTKTFEVSVQTSGDEGSFRPRSATFSPYTNTVRNLDFELTKYFKYSGYVLYAGTSIPVADVSFYRDGVLVTNLNGEPVKTDNNGAFTISIPQGSHKVCAAKDGHVMTNNGFILNEDSRTGDKCDYYWSRDVSDITLWDETRVSLHGRVAGGNDQGLLPLGKSLSVNNIGDDIKIVLQLEGDNTSWIVRDELDSSVKSRLESFSHGVSDTTSMLSERHRIVISPDNKSGEYLVKLPPVKYKVVEISATGYSTLFQAGKVGETLDLSDYKLGDTAVYSRIYHNPAILKYQQLTNGKDSFFGNRSYNATDNTGDSKKVTLWTDSTGYTFGHPVFTAGTPYVFTLQAQEEYYYNNSTKNAVDVVKLSGGKVNIHNSTVSANDFKSIELDKDGSAVYTFTPANISQDFSAGTALRSVTMTMLMDNTYYDATPLSCYVMVALPKPNGKRVVSAGPLHLADILRDPPGQGSYSYIESGSTLSYGYDEKLKFEAGTNLSIGTGSGANGYMGTIAGMSVESGKTFSSESLTALALELVMKIESDASFTYSIKTNEKIQTSSDKKRVGPKADLFIGMQQNIIIQEATAIRAVPSAMFKRLAPGVKSGKVHVISSGFDPVAQDTSYLIYDDVISANTKVASSFIHTADYIEKDLLPELLRIRNSLILPVGTSDDDALAISRHEKRAAFVSLVDLDDEDFGFKYKKLDAQKTYTDSIATLNQIMEAWLRFLYINEQEKVLANDFVANYDLDGTSVSYSDEYAVSSSVSKYVCYPGSPGGGKASLISNTASSIGKLIGKGLVELLKKAIKKTADSTTGGDKKQGDSYNFDTPFGFRLKIDLEPKFEYSIKGYEKHSESYTKKTGFVIAPAKNSSLDVDVYRCKQTAADLSPEYLNRFKKDSFDNNADDFIDVVKDNNTTYWTPSDYVEYSNFVFRTRGGQTRGPYEDAVTTKYFMPGTEISAATVPVDNLSLWTDKAEVSNVPYGEPARFSIFMSNDTQFPNRSEVNFTLMQTDASNAKGAKILIDGAPIDGSGRSVYISPGNVVEKVVEVYAGTDYDYDNLTLSLLDPEDVGRIKSISLSAHFVPSAGNVHISSPGDKWVINTESPYDSTRLSYYMPVRIDGFNVNHRGFDHIELQYKLATQGEKDWVNVCSYYKSDSLMALASGQRKLIMNDGYIDERFFAEKDPIEQDYELRAMVYCRNGNGFVTSSSEILPGVKDTRRPQLFGTPQPINGVLGIGGDIKMVFSEPIAGNYLSDINNFEVFGLTNSTSISEDVSARFSGSNSYARTGYHNLAYKDFSVDLMIFPDEPHGAMTVFQQGLPEEDGMLLRLLADNRLELSIGGKTIVSDKAVVFNSLHQIVLTYHSETSQVSLYDGNTLIGSDVLEKPYVGSGAIYIGGTESSESGFVGNILEFRLWNRCQSPGEIAVYGGKHLTGYELGLVDCFHLNEGAGIYSYNAGVGGSDLVMEGVAWNVPAGISLRLSADSEGVTLNPKTFERTDYEDFSLSVWLKTTDPDGSIIANGAADDPLHGYNQFNLALKDGKIVYTASGISHEANSSAINDGQWHNVVLTVCRSRNVGNVFVDGYLVNSFTVDKIGGISGGTLTLGSVFRKNDEGVLVRSDFLDCNIDELAFYEMSLPENLIKGYGNMTPSGTEIGLLSYLSFSKSLRQSDNSFRLMPVGTSLKKHKDPDGYIIESKVDTIIAADVIERLADRNDYAPMKNIGQLENIKHSFVTIGNELIVNLDVPDYKVEKTGVMVTVKDVADLNGNLMASPVAMTLYVYRNPLRWESKSVDIETNYGSQSTVKLSFQNLSGRSISYRLEGLPSWMTLSESTGRIAALSEHSVTLSISEFTNIGIFDEVLYLVSEDGMTEPLPLTITVKGERPDWTVSAENRKHAMHVVARVIMDGIIANRSSDMLGAFGPGNVCLGVADMTVDKTDGAEKPVVYMTVYSEDGNPVPLTYQFYDSSTGKITVVNADNAEAVTFTDGAVFGSSNKPVVFTSSSSVVQTIALHKGWNWVSFYVDQEEPDENGAVVDDKVLVRLGDVLTKAAVWLENDAFEFVTDTFATVMSYSADEFDYVSGEQTFRWDEANMLVHIDPTMMYRIYSGNDKNSYISGVLASPVISLHKGWNRIGYISDINLPLATALGDYTDQADEGDLIKSEDQFAVLSVDAGNNKRWEGSLSFMKSGMGYMLLRSSSEPAQFEYPRYTSANRYTGALKAALSDDDAYNTGSATNMCVIASVEGLDIAESDVLVASRGNVVVGRSTPGSQDLFFLSVGDGEVIGAPSSAPVTFSVERAGRVVADGLCPVVYSPNALLGSLAEPFVIRFSAADADRVGDDSDLWFSLSGVRLFSRPSMPGLYIHNGKRELVK